MRAIGVNRRPADNRLAAAVPTARRKAAALGGTVLQTATDQRRAVKAALSGRLTESTAPGSGSRPSHRHRTWRAGAAAPMRPARRRPLASPARTRCSTAASTPRNLPRKCAPRGRPPRRPSAAVVRVADDQLEAALEDGVDRLPLHPGALHADVRDPEPLEPGA